jgi:hypothetical protein
MREANDGVIFGCLADHAMVVLPGKPWEVEPPSDPVFFHASRQYFNASMRLSDPGETQYPLEEHLQAIYQGIAGAKSPGHVGAMKGVKIDGGRPVILFEVTGIELEGKPVRSIHVWTALRRPDRRYVDYHLSWTGPADDPELAGSQRRAPLPDRMVNFTSGFVTVDDQGHAPAQ